MLAKILTKKLLYVSFTSLFLVLFLFLFAFSLETNNEICNENECFPRVFVATEEFQEVREGQEIPPGLHVKIDFNTGKKHAKILDPNDHESSEVIIINEDGDPIDQEEIEPGHKIIGDTSDGSKENKGPSLNFHQDSKDNFSLPIITSRHKENIRIPSSDHIQFELYISQLQNSSSLQVLVSALDGLEDLVHELDFGIKLAKGQGIISILSLLDHDSAQIKKKAAIVIGTAMQNNPTAQDDVKHLRIVSRLLDRLSNETDVKVSIRLIYALSSIVRGNQNAIQSIKDNNGLQRLSVLYGNRSNNEFRAKCALFVTDFIDPNMIEIGQNTVFFEQDQYDVTIDPITDIIEVWCKQFQDTLFDDKGNSNEVDFDSKEKILRGISMIKSQYSSSCTSQSGFKKWLIREGVVTIGEDYLEDYFRLIDQVQTQFGF
ncbi:armadillo-type protein [Glomus cerebriforme]|uniref:Nucleotide exchange factor SIL1 n=1 Tax=Glomus cerebriforme TaxID=658196 RepID=A0A397STW2_9GLOM|nr:armadillo-type protein [Glomus cerebriforme]